MKDDFEVEVDLKVLKKHLLCFDSNEEEVVPKVDDVSLVDGVFDGAFGRDGDEYFVIGEEGLEEEAWVEAIKVEEK
ncbi:hypothetical protein Tco_0467689 [Tanacetum coccineum]